ncbi:MAG: glycosyltransferase family 39 protein [Ardenticatenaceae bacterium]
MAYIKNPRLQISIISIIFVLFVLCYHSLIPFFEGPDSGAHFRYIEYLHNTPQRPPLTSESAGISHQLVQQPPLYYALAAILNANRELSEALSQEIANPYYLLNLSRRATVSAPVAPAPAALVPLRIAVLVSMVGGLLTVVGTWLLVREWLPDEPLLAAAAAVVVGWNPQFLFSSATITNDTWASATVVLTLWGAVRAMPRNQAASRWLWVGVSAGLAMLAKYSGLLVLILLALLLVAHVRRVGWASCGRIVFAIAAGVMLIAGFWYGGNLLQWGTPLPMGHIRELLPGLARERVLSLDDLWFQVQTLSLLHSYWGAFGYGVLADPQYYQILYIFTFGGTVGLLLLLPRGYNSNSSPESRTRLLLALFALLWFAAFFVSLLNWMRLMNYSDQGRLLFPAAPAIAILLLLGWQAWLPQRWQAFVPAVIPLFFLGFAISQLSTLANAYRIPPVEKPPLVVNRPMIVDFDGGMTLLGINLPAGAAAVGGGKVPITLYFQARHEIPGFYTLFLHLNDEENHGYASYDGVPAQGRHPTRQWMPNAIFADSYLLDVAEVSEDKLLTLTMGFYDYSTLGRQAVLDENGQPVDNRAVLAQIRLHKAPLEADGATSVPSSEQAPVATWENGMILRSFEVQMEEGAPLAVQVEWETDQIIHTSYTVFVQLLDHEGKLLSQIDQQPQANMFPTDTWRPGDLIEDSYRFDQPSPEWQRLIIGFYDQSGKRLLLQGEKGLDYIELLSKAQN